MSDLRTILALFLAIAPAPAQGNPPPPTATLHATVAAAHRVQVKARASGRVARVMVQVGDTVAGLDKLAQLSAPDLVADLGACEARLNAAEQRTRWHAAEVKKLKQRARQSEATAASAKELVTISKSQVDAQEQTVRGLVELSQAGRAEHSQVFEARRHLLTLKHEHSRSELLAAEARERADELKITAEQAEITAVEHRSTISALRGERDRAAAMVDALDIKSVLERAVVSEVAVGPGDFVRAGEDKLFELVDARKVMIEVHVPAHISHRVGAGCAVRFVEDGQQLASGKVARYSGAVLDNGFAAAWIDLDNADGAWIPGRVLQAELELLR